jgi:thioester reductase-like protein
VHVSRRGLQRNQLRFVPQSHNDLDAVAIASCGKPAAGVEIRIVAPKNGRAIGADAVGEIWLTGKSKALGYWNRPDLTQEIFRARLEGERSEFLHTGDMGFLHDGELYVCGRLKDMIVVHGVNVYPTDIETLVSRALAPLHHARVAAFGFGPAREADDGVVVLIEAGARNWRPDLPTLYRRLKTHVNVPVLALACVSKGSLPGTSSGKIARHRCRELWRAGSMRVLERFDPGMRGTGLSDLQNYLASLIEKAGGDLDLTLAELGLDSFELVQLSLAIERLLVAQIGSECPTDAMFDLRTLQSMSLERLKLMTELVASGRIGGDRVRCFYQQAADWVSDRDASSMRADAGLAETVKPSNRRVLPPSQCAQSILLTGATGFLGSHLLQALLHATDASIVALARGQDRQHAQSRVAAALRLAGGETDHCHRKLDSRVKVVSGDIALPRLGLTQREWSVLSERLGAVFHCAAEVDYVKTYAELRAANVLGTREVIELCCTGSPKVLHHISTTFIFGWTTQSHLFEDDCTEAMLGLDFGYIQSKWVAEQLVKQASARGLQTRIYRPSLVTASRQGQYLRDDILVRVLTYMIRHGLSCDATNQISLLPVDICAQHIAALALRDDPDEAVFHLTTDDYATLQMACRCITEVYGYAFDYVDIHTLIEHMNRHCGPNDILFPLVAFFRANRHKIEAMREKRYDNSNYRAARARLRDLPPQPGLRDTMKWIVDFLRSEGLIPAIGNTTQRRENAASASGRISSGHPTAAEAI